MIQNRDTVDYLKDTDIQVELSTDVLKGFIGSSKFGDSLISIIADKNASSDSALSNEELQIVIDLTDIVEQTRSKALRMLDRL